MTKTLIYLSNKEDYTKDILKILNQENNKICYITLNKTCVFLSELFRKNNLDLEKFYFIDCISAVVKEPAKFKNCDFVSAPYELGEISKSVLKAIKNGHNIIIFDSLSSLIPYGLYIPAGLNVIKKFTDNFLNLLEKNNGKIIFFCNKDDKEKFLILETLPIFEEIKENV
jgi:hypothetical protein